MQEVEETVVEHGDLLRTFKRECRRAFSHTLQATLVMRAGPGKILALQCVGGSETLHMHTRKRAHTHTNSLSLALALALALSLSL
jgi:hypothetical protein